MDFDELERLESANEHRAVQAGEEEAEDVTELWAEEVPCTAAGKENKQADAAETGGAEQRPAEELKVKSGRFARLLLWPRGVPEPEPDPGQRRIRHVCVFGPHHSCTNAMVDELPRFFHVEVVNKRYADNWPNWKHGIFTSQIMPRLRDHDFCICLVKDPAFWVQSLGRDPQEGETGVGTFYEIAPVRARSGANGYLEVEELLAPRNVSQLFDKVKFPSPDRMGHPSRIFSDAVEVWEDTVRGYFNESVFPLAQTAVVRCEDFQFRFGSVIKALARRGLPLREDHPRFVAQEKSAKDPSHPKCTRRKRTELLKYYGDPRNRFAKLDAKQAKRLSLADPALTEALNYGEDAVATWLVD